MKINGVKFSLTMKTIVVVNHNWNIHPLVWHEKKKYG